MTKKDSCSRLYGFCKEESIEDVVKILEGSSFQLKELGMCQKFPDAIILLFKGCVNRTIEENRVLEILEKLKKMEILSKEMIDRVICLQSFSDLREEGLPESAIRALL